jgi:hypothetical protein
MRQLATILFLLAAPPALAEEAPPSSAPAPTTTTGTASPTRVGLGAGFGSGNTFVFYVPIQIGRSFRLEPELGLLNVSVNSFGQVREAHAARVGIGLAWTSQVWDQVRSYAGVRLQETAVSYSGSGASASGTRAAVMAGGEWLPVPRVSLGIEAQVGYAYATDSQSGLGLVPGNGLDTGVLFLARIYIW